jgi:hypothetical protein
MKESRAYRKDVSSRVYLEDRCLAACIKHGEILSGSYGIESSGVR